MKKMKTKRDRITETNNIVGILEMIRWSSGVRRVVDQITSIVKGTRFQKRGAEEYLKNLRVSNGKNKELYVAIHCESDNEPKILRIFQKK